MLGTMQDGQLSIANLLRHGSRVHANAEVITWMGTESRRTTFAGVAREAAKLAHALRGLGVTADQRVGTFMWNNAEHLTAYVAVPAMGAVLHTLNIRLFPEQLTYVANHAEDHVVLVDGTLVPLLAKVLPTFDTVRHVVVVNGDASTLQAPEGVTVHSYSELLADQQDEFDWPVVDELAAAAMCYTSGTTGDPKGVVYTHRSLWLHSMQVCMTDSMALAQTDRALVIVPQFHAMSWGLPYAALMVGATLIMPDRFLQPEPMAALIAAEKPTMAGAVPTVWQGLLSQLNQKPQDLAPLSRAIVGGSAVPPTLMAAFDKLGVTIIQAWGMTETSPLGSVARPPAGVAAAEAQEYRILQGRFPASVRARIMDDDGNELPWDNEAIGELEVAGPWVAASYYRVAAGGDGSEKFRDGWLRTGDVGAITADGFLRLTDRSKDIIKSGGEWISSVDLENAVMAHPAVAEAAVVGVPDEKWSERPLVAVVLRSGEAATPAELRTFLEDKIAKWQLPENWTFIDEVPKTSVGKFDKKRIRAAAADGSLDITHLS
jgi:fatty-acyl-CoA synthase